MSKMISYGKQSIEQIDIDAVIAILKNGWLTQGPNIEIFEKDLNDYFGSQYSCAVSNGTAALHLAGLALGWEPDDIVITTPITFLATVNSIIYAGATPEFVDIDPITYNIDPNLVEDKVKLYKNNGKKIKAIIGVDYAGHPCDWLSLREIANKYDVQLVNDNCHALGASYLEDKYYAVKYADVVIQSYHPVKHITTGEGGAVLTNNSHYDKKVRELRTHGMTKNVQQLEKNDGPWYYEMHDIGYNYRITDFQCALGSSQLRRLAQFIEKRHKIANLYNKSFSNVANLITPNVNSDIDHAFHLYPLQIKFSNLNISKKILFEKMKNFGINLQVHYIPVHLQPFYKKKYGFKDDDFPISKLFYTNEISLPIYPDLSINDVERVINNILGIISE